MDAVPYSPYGLCGRKATLNTLIELRSVRGQELCESSRGGRPGLPVPNSPYGLCGRKATLNKLRGVADESLLMLKVRARVTFGPT